LKIPGATLCLSALVAKKNLCWRGPDRYRASEEIALRYQIILYYFCSSFLIPVNENY